MTQQEQLTATLGMVYRKLATKIVNQIETKILIDNANFHVVEKNISQAEEAISKLLDFLDN